MQRQTENLILAGLFTVLFLSLAGIVINKASLEGVNEITGAPTTASTTSQAVISTFFSISLSTNLSGGIDFGTISTVPATDVNATGNLNGSLNQTLYYITVSGDSNTAVDFCQNASNFAAGANQIGVGNQSYSFSNVTNNQTLPNFTVSTAFTTAYVAGATGVVRNTNTTYRFFLDVPSAQAAGTYTNNVAFKGVATGAGC
jgi:hypothetical protein